MEKYKPAELSISGGNVELIDKTFDDGKHHYSIHVSNVDVSITQLNGKKPIMARTLSFSGVLDKETYKNFQEQIKVSNNFGNNKKFGLGVGEGGLELGLHSDSKS